MGAGKTSVGRRLAARLDLSFVDADTAIEEAAGCTIEDYFAQYGEEAFRAGEKRVIARLLERPMHVLATGGGAFMDAETRAGIRKHCISVWLRAEIDLLLSRIGRRSTRPLLKHATPRQVLEDLMKVRYPIYAEADIVVDSVKGGAERTTDRVIRALERYLAGDAAPPDKVEMSP